MKEVKIKINVEKIFTACQGIKSTDDLLKYDTPKDYTDLIDRIFKDSIEIASGADNTNEVVRILKILKCRVQEYFAYNTYGKHLMHGLYKALQSKKKEEVRKHFISVINDVIKPNTHIYSPCLGIHIQNDRSKHLGINIDDEMPDLTSPRTCTLRLDDKSSNLISMWHDIKERLDKESLCHIANLLYSENSKHGKNINILKKYLPEDKYYSLHDLYFTKRTLSGSLVDRGLKLTYSKYYEIKELAEQVKTMESERSTRLEEIYAEIEKVLREEELVLVLSVLANIEKIKHEKTARKG
ncbi:hypothetical protein NEMIN01_2491, partial [Nematocida minor]|uniref:uncharacterized protein n=1 Tax=Nematocida minor TaxID=1912983 RepID=UPI00221FFAC8